MRNLVLFCCCLFQYLLSSAQHKTDDYLLQRQELTHADQQNRFDGDVVLNEDEKKAGQKLQLMQQTLAEKYKADKFFPPSRTFYQSKTAIEKTTLFQVLEKMPKGGALHLHTSGTTSISWVVNTLVGRSDSYVYWLPDNETYIRGQIAFFKADAVPAGFQRAMDLNAKEKDFKASLTQLLTIGEKTFRDSAQVWKEFGRCFMRIDGFVSYKPIFEAYYLQGFNELITDNIQYAEVRAIVSPSLYDLNHTRESHYYPTDSIIQYFRNVRKKLNAVDPQFRFRLVYTFLRRYEASQIDAEFLNAFKVQKKHGDLVSGFDLVGEEDKGHTTLFFLHTWLKRDSLEKAYGLKMPFLFHDGESNELSDDNLYDAVLLGSKRIGHGFNLFLFPGLYQQIKAKNIAIEVCPLSSQLLNYTRDLRTHPGIGYLRNGIQCVISSDDPSIFGFKGLSYDYWSVFMAWDLDLKALKKLSRNSIAYSLLPDAEKELALAEWANRWNVFVAYVNAMN